MTLTSTFRLALMEAIQRVHLGSLRGVLKLSLRSRSLRSATAVSSTGPHWLDILYGLWLLDKSSYRLRTSWPLVSLHNVESHRAFAPNKNLDPVWFVYSICILAFSRISATQKPLTQSRCRTSFSATHHSRETRSDMKNFCAAVANCVAQSFEAFLRLFEISLIKKLEGGEGVATPPRDWSASSICLPCARKTWPF